MNTFSILCFHPEEDMDVLKEFLESTTIHGLTYISSAKVNRNLAQLCNWILTLIRYQFRCFSCSLFCIKAPYDDIYLKTQILDKAWQDPVGSDCLSGILVLWHTDLRIICGFQKLANSCFCQYKAHKRS